MHMHQNALHILCNMHMMQLYTIILEPEIFGNRNINFN